MPDFEPPRFYNGQEYPYCILPYSVHISFELTSTLPYSYPPSIHTISLLVKPILRYNSGCCISASHLVLSSLPITIHLSSFSHFCIKTLSLLHVQTSFLLEILLQYIGSFHLQCVVFQSFPAIFSSVPERHNQSQTRSYTLQ